jgi:hypothetical protein
LTHAPALPVNIMLGWKLMAVKNALAYYDTAIVTPVKCFIVQALGIPIVVYIFQSILCHWKTVKE